LINIGPVSTSVSISYSKVDKDLNLESLKALLDNPFDGFGA